MRGKERTTSRKQWDKEKEVARIEERVLERNECTEKGLFKNKY